jgi:hypothetical protein
MSSVVLSGDTSGQVSLTVPAIAGSNTVTIPAGTGTAAVQGVSTNIVSGTAVASTSGTAIDFTGIPSWVKRITVMFNGVSLSGTSNLLVQVGSGSVTTSGYSSTYSAGSGSTISSANSTAGFIMLASLATATASGILTIQTLGSNIWVSGHTIKSNTTNTSFGGGDITLGGVLDRVRITTTNGTDTFKAGSINILYE